MSLESALNSDQLFNNLPEVLTADQVADLLSVKRMTVYNWKYKRKTIKEMPEDLFIGSGRPLRIKTSALRKWLAKKSC